MISFFWLGTHTNKNFIWVYNKIRLGTAGLDEILKWRFSWRVSSECKCFAVTLFEDRLYFWRTKCGNTMSWPFIKAAFKFFMRWGASARKYSLHSVEHRWRIAFTVLLSLPQHTPKSSPYCSAARPHLWCDRDNSQTNDLPLTVEMNCFYAAASTYTEYLPPILKATASPNACTFSQPEIFFILDGLKHTAEGLDRQVPSSSGPDMLRLDCSSFQPITWLLYDPRAMAGSTHPSSS